MANENTNDRPMGQPLDMSRGTPARRRDKRDTWDRWDTWDISKLNGALASDAERPMPDARRNVAGSAEGK
jgi:hypothetical protein